MALVQVARYADLREAQVAAGMLRAQGMHVVLPEEQITQTNFLLSQAVGGCRLCVAEEDAEDALALIAPHRVGAPAALDWRSHPEALTTAPSSVFWAIMDPTGGFAWGRLRKRFTVTAFLGLLLGLLVIALFAAAWIGAGR
jgi:hypothetical protein